MSNLARFGVSLDKELLRKFDERIKEKKYTNRSEAIRDLIRDDLVKKNGRKAKKLQGQLPLSIIIIRGN